ncbi:hypothetical protein CesoFtcFv8_005046 [Champsocephalus esox]|uniref:Uncharacterized protein n=1 Tax=Champsocephalus esox TaxID=159716 RepID=A0AAN8CNU7_9TELE|nr:hypothetical protein CesoFtcFv8_005046 [Champsocephalus esox]
MLPVFVIPGAVCGQRAWRLELSVPSLRRQPAPLLSPTRNFSGSLHPPPFSTNPCRCLSFPSPQASTAPTNRCFDKCFKHNVTGNPPACQKC